MNGVICVSEKVDSLLRLLKNEHEIYADILEFSKAKKQTIIDGDIKELDKMTKQEQVMVKTIIELEKTRARIVDDISISLGISKVKNITELMDYFDAEQKIQFKAVKDELSTIVEELSYQNEQNGKLIGQSLEIIDFNLNLIESVHNQHAGYGSDADEKDVKRKSNLFDVKV